MPAFIIYQCTLDYLSPSLAVMPSKNSQKSIYLPNDSRSAIILKIVGFLLSNPKLCIADFSSLGSIFPVAQVSKRLKASLSYQISSYVSPGLQIFFLAGPFAGGLYPLVVIITNLNKIQSHRILLKITMYKYTYQLSNSFRKSHSQSNQYERSFSTTHHKQKFNQIKAKALNNSIIKDKPLTDIYSQYQKTVKNIKDKDKIKAITTKNQIINRKKAEVNSYLDYKLSKNEKNIQQKSFLSTYYPFTETKFKQNYLKPSQNQILSLNQNFKILTPIQITAQKEQQYMKIRQKERIIQEKVLKQRQINERLVKNKQLMQKQLNENSKFYREQIKNRQNSKINVNDENQFHNRNQLKYKNMQEFKNLQNFQGGLVLNKLSSLQQKIRLSLQPLQHI